MIETIALVLVIAILAFLLGWLDHNNRKERSKLINALIAQTPEQLRDLEFVDKVQPQPVEQKPPDIVPMESLSEEEFDTFIKKEIEDGG